MSTARSPKLKTLIAKVLIKLSKSGTYTGIGILKSTNSDLKLVEEKKGLTTIQASHKLKALF